MSDQTLIIIFICSVIITFAMRALPFVLFGRGNEVPKLVKRLGELLPYAVIAALVVYCLKDVMTFSLLENAKLLGSVLVVVIVHIWKKNTILSIAAGTFLYMLLLHI